MALCEPGYCKLQARFLIGSHLTRSLYRHSRVEYGPLFL